MAGSHVRYEREKDSGDLKFCFKYMDRVNLVNLWRYHKGSINFKHRRYTYIGDIYEHYRDHFDMGDCQDYWELVELQMFVCLWASVNRCSLAMQLPMGEEEIGFQMFYRAHDVFEYRGIPWWESHIDGLDHKHAGFFNFEKGVAYYGRVQYDRMYVENMYGDEEFVGIHYFIPVPKHDGVLTARLNLHKFNRN